MWLLFVYVLVSGQPVVDYRAFDTKEDCIEGKSFMMTKLAAKLPRYKASLTCVKLEPLNNLI